MRFKLSGTSETGVFDEKSPSGNDYLSEVLILEHTFFMNVNLTLSANRFAPLIYICTCVCLGLQRMGRDRSESE